MSETAADPDTPLTTASAPQPPALPRLRFHLSLDPARLFRARQRLRDYLHEHLVEQAAAEDIVLFLEEAMTNAVRHSGARQDLELDLDFSDGDLLMTVRDYGRGFDVSSFAPDVLPDFTQPSGRGLYLMAHLADEMTLRSDHGLTIHAVKRGVLRATPGAQTAVTAVNEQAHRDAREQCLIDEIDEGFFVLDWEYRYRQVNDAFGRLFGRPREAFLGRTIWDATPAPPDEAFAALRDAMELGRPTILEYVSPTLGRWLELRVYAISSGVTAYLRDIDERRHRELERDEILAALRASEERYRNLIETTGEGVLVGGPDGVILYANQQMAEMLGYTADELVGTPGLELVAQEWQPKVMANRAALESGNVIRGEILLRRRDGTGLWTMWSASPMFDEEGRHVANLTMHSDISERKHAEDELRRLYETQRDIALTLQRSFRHTVPELPYLEVGLVEAPAAAPDLVGGDLWDLIQLDDGRVLALMGDVSGKGIPAAGRTWTVRSAVNALARVAPEPGFILNKTNALLLSAEAEEWSFVTALVVVVDRAGAVATASAGHPAPIRLTQTHSRLLEPVYGPPLGAMPTSYLTTRHVCAGEDYLVLYTDGVTEARRHGELFGEKRLLEAVRELYGQPAQVVAEGVRAAAEAFAGRLDDDLSVLVLRWRPQGDAAHT